MFASSSNDLAMTDDGVAASVLDHVNVTVMTGVMLGVIAFVEVGMILLSWAIYKVRHFTTIYSGRCANTGCPLPGNGSTNFPW